MKDKLLVPHAGYRLISVIFWLPAPVSTGASYIWVMDKLIASPIVAISGRHFGYFDVYEIEPGKYKAIPRNKWESTGPDEYKEFIFYKKGRKWITEPTEYAPIVEQIIEGCGF